MFKNRLMVPALMLAALSVSLTLTTAQQRPNEPTEATTNLSDLTGRMMKFDKDGDGKLAKAEITDARLVRLFNRADANNDGVVTKGELDALEAKEQANTRQAFGSPGGPGGGMGGPMGGPPGPGEVLPEMFRNRLNLTADQQSQLDELQRDVDARMSKILSDAQKSQLKQMRDRGPGGPPPGGGRPGRGGPGGNGFPPPPPQ